MKLCVLQHCWSALICKPITIKCAFLFLAKNFLKQHQNLFYKFVQLRAAIQKLMSVLLLIVFFVVLRKICKLNDILKFDVSGRFQHDCSR